MEGEDVAPFTLFNRTRIDGSMGFPKQAGYDTRHVFREQEELGFGVTHEVEKAYNAMKEIWYMGNIDKYLLKLENFNIRAQVTRVAWRSLVERRLPQEALKLLSNQEYSSDEE